MINRKKRLLLLAAWITTNFLGISVATIVVFFLYATLEINRYSYSQDWLRVIKGIAFCGLTQGLIIASFQSVVLFIAKIPIVRWFIANIIGMTIGMILPIFYGIIVAKSTSEYIIPAWILSWILPAILCVLVTFKGKNSRLRKVITNSIAYLCWGLSLIISFIFLGAYFDKPEAAILIFGIFLMLSIFAIGAWLNSYVFLSFYDKKKQNNTII